MLNDCQKAELLPVQLLPFPMLHPMSNPFRATSKNQSLARTCERLLGLNPMIRYYDRWQQQLREKPLADDKVADEFLDYTLSAFETDIRVDELDKLEQIPPEGPVITCANHPFGGLEGMLLARLLKQRRPDVKVLTNRMLSRIPEFDQLFVGVNVFPGSSNRDNLKGIKTVCQHLDRGGVLLVFPAGIVATGKFLRRGTFEWPWRTTAARLARKYQAHCLPIHVHGSNSRLFQYLGWLPRPFWPLRTAMLPRELANKRGRTVRVTVGDLIPAADIASFPNDEALTQFLRDSCLRLGDSLDLSAAALR